MENVWFLFVFLCFYYTNVCIIRIRAHICMWCVQSLFFFLYVYRRRIKKSKEVRKLAMRIDGDPVMRVSYRRWDRQLQKKKRNLGHFLLFFLFSVSFFTRFFPIRFFFKETTRVGTACECRSIDFRPLWFYQAWRNKKLTSRNSDTKILLSQY